MDKQHIKGQIEKTKGKIKEEIGEATDNEELEAEGHADQAEGKIRKTVGDIKDVFD